MNDKTYQYYLRDLGVFLKEDALEAKMELHSAPPGDRAFLQGKLIAYNQIISLLISQATAFDIPLEDISLKGFDPDRDL
jgi:hypothetical protein